MAVSTEPETVFAAPPRGNSFRPVAEGETPSATIQDIVVRFLIGTG